MVKEKIIAKKLPQRTLKGKKEPLIPYLLESIKN
jgi:hypothetical protein